jgi:SAM-dependent methyltransferase
LKKIKKILKKIISSIFEKEQENFEEQYFYFVFPISPLSPGFSHVDLGCGGRKAKAKLLGYPERQSDIVIDKTKENTQADLLCNLGLENLPLEDNSQDLVAAYDLAEHIPKVCVVRQESRLYVYIYPVINLFNEVYRVLKAGGLFEIVSPGIPNYWNGAIRDPTHVSLWCLGSFDYFYKGRFEALSHSYGLRYPFDKVRVDWQNISHIQAVLQKPLIR